MKCHLSRPISTGLLLLLLSRGAAHAQNPTPPPPVTTLTASAGPLDPTTGLPQPGGGWISPDWTDPHITLPNVRYDGLPASEVAKDLRKLFNDSFDIVISPGRMDPSGSVIGNDPGTENIRLELKNVTASELFRAMNLLLETENSPFRWQLLVNGNRPLVLFREVPELLRGGPPAVTQKQTAVVYVGDLVNNGGLTLKQISDTLADVNSKAFNGDISISFHDETQLVIVKGTSDQINLVHNTLNALKQKIPKTSEAKEEMDETKAALSSLATFINSLKNNPKADEPKAGNGGAAR
jgi:hypothetical protein